MGRYKHLTDILWVDDMRDPITNEWTNWFIKNVGAISSDAFCWVKNFDEFKEYIDNYGRPRVICFDHDLGETGENERNGLTCAKYLVEYCMKHNLDIPEYCCQTSNPVGKENISLFLNNYHKIFNINK